MNNTNTPYDRCTHEEFVNIVNSYDHVFHAVHDGVGVTHSFPPRGDMEYSWKKIIHASMTTEQLEELKENTPEEHKRAVEELHKKML